MKNITHVLTNPQDLTEERKRQARENIDAAWGAVVPADADETNLLVSTTTMNTVIDEKLANFGGFAVVPLIDGVPDPSQAIPQVKLSTKIIYLTKDASAGKTDPYTEWIYTGDTEHVDPTKWEVIGETSPDMDSKEDKANKVAEWSSTPTDEHYPSEKLVKDALDTKADASDMETALAGKLDVDGEYVKDATLSQDTKTLTITKSDDSQVTFSGVPTVQQGDAGKVLIVDENNNYAWDSIPDASGKADKPPAGEFTPGNLAELTDEGNLADAGLAIDQLALKPTTQVTEGNIASLDDEGNLVDSGHSADDLHSHANKNGLDRIPNDLPPTGHDYMLHTDGSTVSWMKWDTITVADPQLYINGTRYNTVTLGNQTWMVENLATESIPGLWYDGNQTVSEENGYGKLYTWDSASQLDVVGWHLPTVDDFNELYSYLQANNLSLLDVHGFNAVKSGYWYSYSTSSGPAEAYEDGGSNAWLWTATEEDGEPTYAYVQKILGNNGSHTDMAHSKTEFCAAVRLVKDR